MRTLYAGLLSLCLIVSASAQTPLLVSHLGAEFHWDLQPFTEENAPDSHVLTCDGSSVTVQMPATSIPIRDVVPGPGSYTCTLYAQNAAGRQVEPDALFPLFQSGYVPRAPFQLAVLAEPTDPGGPPIMATITITDNTGGTPGVASTQIRQADATTNYGTDSTFETTKWSSGDHTHALLKFDLSSVSGPVTVTSVTVGIFQNGAGGATAQTLDFRRLLRNWVENEVTWNIYSTGNNWTTAGGLSDGNDRQATASGQITGITTTSQYYTVVQTSGGLVDDVQGWINGSFPNYGWHLSRNGTGNDATYRTWISDDGSNEFGPYLTVEYTTGGGGTANSYYYMANQ